MDKIVIFDWGGVIMNKFPDVNNDKEAIIRTIKSFAHNLSDEEAWEIYVKTLVDENGIFISRQNDENSKIKWLQRIETLGKFETTLEEFTNKFIEEHLSVGYYKGVVAYAHSLKERCLIGIFSDLIYSAYPILDKQVNLSKFDYVWLSYLTHLRKDTEEAFVLVEQNLQLQPENILFVDDTTINIENAKRRNWNTCQARGYELQKIKRYVEQFLIKDFECKSNKCLKK